MRAMPLWMTRMRYYGFLSPTFGVPLEEIKARVEMAHGFVTQPGTGTSYTASRHALRRARTSVRTGMPSPAR